MHLLVRIPIDAAGRWVVVHRLMMVAVGRVIELIDYILLLVVSPLNLSSLAFGAQCRILRHRVRILRIIVACHIFPLLTIN